MRIARPRLTPIVALIVALCWAQWVLASHQHDAAAPTDGACDICLVAQHGKSAAADTTATAAVRPVTQTPLPDAQHSLVSRAVPQPASRGPPVLAIRRT